MDRKSAARLAAGLVLAASGFAVFLIYLAGGYGPLYLVPIGVFLFSAGFYLSVPYLKFLQPFKRTIPFFAAALLLIAFIPPNVWQNSIFGSVYGSLLIVLSRKLGVLVLNAEGIGAIQGAGSTIVLPSASKVASVTIAQACGGVEEILIFFVAFAFMLMDVGRKAPKKAMVLLPVGFVGTYLVSIVRLDAVIVTGYLYGYDAMETAHLYLGVLLYLAFISAFWYLSLKWIGIGNRAKPEVLSEEESATVVVESGQRARFHKQSESHRVRYHLGL
ncbi:MAG: exosortase/archaeosortase family protein [Nitrososphaerales archaeon]